MGQMLQGADSDGYGLISTEELTAQAEKFGGGRGGRGGGRGGRGGEGGGRNSGRPQRPQVE